MSYDISFRVKVEGIEDYYVPVGDCYANITYNVRQMIVESTGLEWKNCENNGFCKDVIPHIERGLSELRNHPEQYKHLESPNGWGTLDGTKRFFQKILDAWDYLEEPLKEVATFWIY